MVNTLAASFYNPTITNSGTFYESYSLTVEGFNLEAANCLYRSTGTLSNFWVQVSVNSNSASTITLRKNGANANETVSITGNTTGSFTDATHTDSMSAGDEFQLQLVIGSGSNIQFSSFVLVFAPSSSTVTRGGSTNGLVISSASTTFYCPPFGLVNNVTTEANTKNRQRKSMTVSNLYIHVFSNSNTNAVTYHSRKNGANGALTISLPHGVSGDLEDTTHSDSISAGDDYNFSYVTGASTVSYQPVTLYADYSSTNGDGILSVADDNLASISTNVTKYWGLGGILTFPDTVESHAQMLVNNAFLFSELTINVQSNTITNASTLTLRANGSNTSLSVSIGASQTGAISDSVDTYNSASTDLVCYQLVTASTGTNMSISHISSFTNVSAPAAGPTGFPRNFRCLPNTPKLISFGNQSPVFGI